MILADSPASALSAFSIKRQTNLWNRKSGAARAESSSLRICRVVTDFDNVKFSNNSIDLQVLREFFASKAA